MNIETILQMQCELLDQQKELKTIELETMEHLRQLNQNISKLAKKFDSFEMSLNNNYSSATATTSITTTTTNNNNNSSSSNCILNNNNNDNQNNVNNIKAAKNAFTKLNSTIGQQLKVNTNSKIFIN